ncbi:MAG: hypothetical protein ACYSUK_00150 [Planctomycetota bacterium]|jgi:hypothetical protein
MLKHICSRNGNVTVMVDDDVHLVPANHPAYSDIVQCIKSEDVTGLMGFLDIRNAVNRYSSGDIKVVDNDVYYRGNIVKNYLTERLIEQMGLGFGFEPMCAFLDNYFDNPNPDSIEQLYPFLENCGLVLTDDGCFLGWKYVYENGDGAYRPGWKNRDGTYHTLKPGAIVSMPREEVVCDPDEPCAAGLHVGTRDYVGNGGDAQFLVKVNPKHAVSVPDEHGHGKLRCCQYECIKVVEFETMDNLRPVYASDGYSKSVHDKGSLDNQTASHWGDNYDKDYDCYHDVIDDDGYCDDCGEYIGPG